MRKLLVLAALAALLVPIEASASVLLGVEGSKSRFRGQTGQATDVNLDFISWGGHKQTYLDNTLADAKPVPVLSFGTVNKYGNEAITPAELAKGKGDRVLIDIAQALDRFGNFAYVRPYAEMNGHWNPYCAFNSNGTYRGERALDEELPQGVPPHVPDRARRLAGGHQRQAGRVRHAEARPDRRLPRQRRQGDLEPAGIRQPRPQGQQRGRVLPGQRLRRRRG